MKNGKSKMKSNNIFLGYSDEELVLKVSEEGINKGSTQWVHWSSELYSVGRLYRQIAYYPKWLPLMVCSDHGVHRSPVLSKLEKESSCKVHFTFNPMREEKGDESKNIHLVPHPWIAYRKKKKYAPIPSAKGTLAFISHSTYAAEYIHDNEEKYF